MNDISYEILDQLKAYGADRQALDKILSENSRPEFLYALSDMRENLWSGWSLQARRRCFRWARITGPSPVSWPGAAPR